MLYYQLYGKRIWPTAIFATLPLTSRVVQRMWRSASSWRKEGAVCVLATVLPMWQLRGGSAHFDDLVGPVIARNVLGVRVVVVVIALLARGRDGCCDA